MQQRRFENREDPFFSDILKIAIGVFIGALAALFAYETINVWRLEYAARQIVQQAQQQEKAARAQAALQQQQQQEKRDAIQASEQLLQRLERERRARKDAAWNAFFQPSTACRADAVTAACANEHMAASKRFEAQYVDR